MSGNILLTCGTSALGLLTIDKMLAQKIPAKTIFFGARDPEHPTAKALSGKGVVVRKMDLADPASIAAAMAGIQTLMFFASEILEKRVEQHLNVLKAAKDAGIKHIVYTSILRCAKDSRYSMASDHVTTEEALLKTGIPYTIFRDTFYMDLLLWILGDAFQTGKWCYPVGNAKINMVAKPDIAEGLAKVLSNLGPHANQTYEITGGKSYTFQEIADIISKAINKPLVYTPIAMDAFKAILKKAGLTEPDVKHFASSADVVASGELDFTDPALEKILGHKTTTMEEFLPTIFKPKDNANANSKDKDKAKPQPKAKA